MAENPAPRRSLKEHVAAARALLSGPRVARVPAADALGRALAVDVAAAEDSPRFTNSQMDGYALREDQRGGGRFRVGPTIPAGADPKDVAPDPWAGDVVLPVMTGARLPEGTAAVVPVERGEPGSFDAAERAGVALPAAPQGQFVRPRGSDLNAGERLLAAGARVNPATVGLLAAQGIGEVPVVAPRRVVVATGGDEVGAPGAARIRDANAPLLAALLSAAGIEIAGHVAIADDPAVLADRLSAEIERTAPDAVVSSGGISRGRFEPVRELLSGGWVGTLPQQPGGPQGLGLFGGVPVIALPGNPVSTLVSGRLIALPALADEPGWASPAAALLDGEAEGLPDDRTQYRRAVHRVDEAGRLVVRLLPGTGSHLLARAEPATCLAAVAPGARLRPGDTVGAYPLYSPRL